MSAEQAYAFIVFAIVAAVTPGPSNVMLTAIGASAGVRRGVPCLLGVGAGAALLLFAVAFGLGAVVLGYPLVVRGMKWCGAGLLLWLSWKIASAEASDAPDAGRPVGFLGAALLQWLNPKVWLVSTSAAGTYLDPNGASAAAQAFALGALFFAAAVPCGLLWLAFGLGVRRLLRSPRTLRAFNIAMGALLAGSVVFFVW